jgi:hypothetical protein
MPDEIDEFQVEAAAMALWRWTRRWYQPVWSGLDIGRKGLCRLMAWSALAAAARVREEAYDRRDVQHNGDGAEGSHG